MEPLKPTWVQPSHPDRLEVIANSAAFTSKSLSLIDLPPFAVFSRLSYPPCTRVGTATYATVQTGRDSHLDLNSDLLYINHSCEPSLIFDTAGSNVLVGPRGIKKGDELTFFYPSTEWHMAQPFTCLCGTPSCRGTIAGARDMTPAQLAGLWINAHILELIAERDAPTNGANGATNGAPEDKAAAALKDAVRKVEDSAAAARAALNAYLGPAPAPAANGVNGLKANGQRRGVTARELAGEMGGDTN